VKKLVLKAEKCVDCVSMDCIKACMKSHSECASLGRAHMYVVMNEQGKGFPVKCDHCEKAPCMEACNRKALIRNNKTGAVLVDKYGCNLCGLCVSACPFGMISEGKKIVHKCDLCKGDPECVRACTKGALLYM
jgi:carbon-monoxide dehydrogenase iron sulfur subunit